MKIIYSQQPIPHRLSKSIFLAGITIRSKEEGISWRYEAISFLQNIGYDGVVFIPEFENEILNTTQDFDYSEQIEWEDKCMAISDRIIFWIARDLDNKTFGLTSNVEYGKYMNSGKVFLGFPKNADKMRYLEHHAKNLNIPIYNDIKRLLIDVNESIGDGAERSGTDVLIPLNVWNHQGFKNWHKSVYDIGNSIADIKTEYVKHVNDNIFFVSIWAKIYIRDENRYKDNEIAFMRSDISSCVLFRKDKNNILNSDIVLIKEFRTPVNNITGKVWKITGGSSFKNDISAFNIIIEEIQEELGINIDSERLMYYQARQLQATTLTHKSHLYYCELNDAEIDYLISQKDIVKGNISETERTYTEVVKLSSILNTEVVDWSNLGQILSIILSKN